MPQDHRVSRYFHVRTSLGHPYGTFEALKPVTCEECGRSIQPGELFTRRALKRPACRECRPFTIIEDFRNRH